MEVKKLYLVYRKDEWSDCHIMFRTLKRAIKGRDANPNNKLYEFELKGEIE
jgi:hypothetical protein